MKRLERNRCDKFARKGTGFGACDAPLDERGECTQQAEHVEEGFTEAPFCQIDPDNGPSFIARQTAKHDIFRVIADRLEQQRVSEENERADKHLRKAQNPRCEAECAEHPAHLWDGTPVPQGKPGGVPCNCQGLSHSNDCPNWELPY